ncbi:MAG: DUF6491 family protein [Gammaproteobacteria bacterium]|nr:DUF6491 family protein [Gammaproteobacteria bacterium]MDH5262784.1 DUF6491 family protein [Gammaproteobacteria bacterium]MDH5584114.1 DUF6491 family protein [Gammaproteobacteria bacterium]
MTRVSLLFAVALVTGCAGTPKDESVLEHNDTIDDYIKVAQLEEVDSIRYYGQLDHKVISKKYIIINAGNDSYLVTYISNCYRRDDHTLKPDIRYESSVLWARSDTYRGCRIQSMHAIDQGQKQELLTLGGESGEQINQMKEVPQ